MRLRSFLTIGCALASYQLALPGFAAAQPAARAEAPLPSVPQVLASVRQAVGYRSLAALPNGFMVTERSTEEGARVESLYFGTRRGELRNGEEFGFDGSFAWQHDRRRGMAIPFSQRQREKLMWPLWVRGFWWLNPRSGIAVRILPGESDARIVALELTLPEGLVPAILYVDRATWLPVRLVVPYERGPFTALYSNYRTIRGLRLPGLVETDYRGRSRRQLLAAAPIPNRAIFAAPAVPADHRFDPSRPAALETLAGAPFGPNSPGHIYVRATADDVRTGWWHFDSGSDGMIIDEAVANALGMEIVGTHRSMGADGTPREGSLRRGKSFSIGRIRIENPIYRAMDLSANNAPPGERRMGTIGYDLFARSVVEYAGGGSDVRICDPRRYRLPRGARWQRLEHIDSTPAARGRVEGRIDGLFQIDTGAAGTIDFARPFHERHRLLANRPTQSARSQGSGGSFTVERGHIARFDFGGRRYDNLEVYFRTGGISREGSAGTVGRDVLAPFRMVFDYANHRVAFAPAAAGHGRCG
ncbi:MAG TPA: retropepsin-like aspartic protease [Allosphingosinicella sp.]|nr:retropepsin-like aspartic protease [Allosphingosinicella sp.]